MIIKNKNFVTLRFFKFLFMLRLHEIIIEMIITTVRITPSDIIMIRCIITNFSSGDHSILKQIKWTLIRENLKTKSIFLLDGCLMLTILIFKQSLSSSPYAQLRLPSQTSSNRIQVLSDGHSKLAFEQGPCYSIILLERKWDACE